MPENITVRPATTVWRAATNVPDADLRPTGERQFRAQPVTLGSSYGNDIEVLSGAPRGSATRAYTAQNAGINASQPLYRPAAWATYEQGLRQADIALYAAKGESRGSFRFFEPAMDARAAASVRNGLYTSPS